MILLPSGVSLSTAWCNSASRSKLDLELDHVLKYYKQIASIRNGRSPLLELPTELLDIVVDYVHLSGGAEATKSCALLCTGLAPIAQARLFMSVTITNSREASLAGALSHARPDLLNAVRELRLSELLSSGDGSQTTLYSSWAEVVGEDELALLFTSFPHVRRLTFIAWPAEDERSLFFTTAYYPVLDMFRKVVDLILGQGPLRDVREEQDICALLGFFSDLRSLSVTKSIDVTVDVHALESSGDDSDDGYEDEARFSWSNLSQQCLNLRDIDVYLANEYLYNILLFIDRLAGAAVQRVILRKDYCMKDEPTLPFLSLISASGFILLGFLLLRITRDQLYPLFPGTSVLDVGIREAGCLGVWQPSSDVPAIISEEVFDIRSIVDPSLRSGWSYELRLGWSTYPGRATVRTANTLVRATLVLGPTL